MSITVPIELGYAFSVKAAANAVFEVLADVPSAASHFPKLHKLVDLGNHTYRWEMEKIGPAQINLQIIYASTYTANKAKGTVIWTPVQGEGNALVSGSWKITDRKKSTDLMLKVEGDLTLPFPGLMKMVVAPVVEAEFENLVEKYIDNLTRLFGGEA